MLNGELLPTKFKSPNLNHQIDKIIGYYRLRSIEIKRVQI